MVINKAFDRVWHEEFIYKLKKTGIPNQLNNILKSFISDRTFQDKTDGNLSSTKSISTSVSQGSCLFSELFSVYVNDMPQHSLSKTTLFTDDTLFYVSSFSNGVTVNKLQTQIDLVLLWLHNWKITINPSKTTAILFTIKSTFSPKYWILKENR